MSRCPWKKDTETLKPCKTDVMRRMVTLSMCGEHVPYRVCWLYLFTPCNSVDGPALECVLTLWLLSSPGVFNVEVDTSHSLQLRVFNSTQFPQIIMVWASFVVSVIGGHVYNSVGRVHCITKKEDYNTHNSDDVSGASAFCGFNPEEVLRTTALLLRQQHFWLTWYYP